MHHCTLHMSANCSWVAVTTGFACPVPDMSIFIRASKVTLEGLCLCEYYQADATLLLVCTYVS